MSRLPALANRGLGDPAGWNHRGSTALCRLVPCVVLCHGLCHNPAIPAGVGPSRAVSLRHTQKAVNERETRMNTAFLCRFVFLCVCPYSFALGNGMEEVIGSIPIRSTK